MNYIDRFSHKREDRLIELISKLTGLDLDQIQIAVKEYGLEKVLDEPTLLTEDANEKIGDLKFFIDYMNREDSNEE